MRKVYRNVIEVTIVLKYLPHSIGLKFTIRLKFTWMVSPPPFCLSTETSIEN